MRYYSNTAVATTLENSGGVTPTYTQLILGSTTGYPTQFPFTVRLDPDTPTEELVNVTSGGGTAANPYVVQRGYDGTVARSHSQYAVVTHGFSAKDFKEPQDHMADSLAHVRRPLISFMAQVPNLNLNGQWVSFTSAQFPALSFSAPPGGMVSVGLGGYIYFKNSTNSLVGVGFRMSGGKVLEAGLDTGLAVDGGGLIAASKEYLVTGLTPGVATVVTPCWYVSSLPAAGEVKLSGLQMYVKVWP